MKTGRNDPCPCGSGKKYKKCCMNSIDKRHAEIADEMSNVIAMNPDLDIDELNIVAKHKMAQVNNKAIDDFCGLSSDQMSNWLYSPISELNGVSIHTPDDLSTSPVMSYLQIIIDEAMENGGSLKLTSRGYLPVKIVKKANALLEQFAMAKYEIDPSISEYQGSNESKFNVLHYTHELAKVAGVIYHKTGKLHIKKTFQKQYQTQGIKAFYLPMLTSAIIEFNWGCFDGWPDEIDIQLFWAFMIWRLQKHENPQQLFEEVLTAFPAVLHTIPDEQYFSAEKTIRSILSTRFFNRFLCFWGFISCKGWFLFNEENDPELVLQPLLKETFVFAV